MTEEEPYSCACGATYPTEAELIQHDVQQHARDAHDAEKAARDGEPVN